MIKSKNINSPIIEVNLYNQGRLDRISTKLVQKFYRDKTKYSVFGLAAKFGSLTFDSNFEKVIVSHINDETIK